jgi:hypothetical protein
MTKEAQNTEVIKQGVGISLLGQSWNFARRLPGKGCNHHSKELCCTVAAAALQTLEQAFKRKSQVCGAQGKYEEEIHFLIP